MASWACGFTRSREWFGTATFVIFLSHGGPVTLYLELKSSLEQFISLAWWRSFLSISLSSGVMSCFTFMFFILTWQNIWNLKVESAQNVTEMQLTRHATYARVKHLTPLSPSLVLISDISISTFWTGTHYSLVQHLAAEISPRKMHSYAGGQPGRSAAIPL